MVGSRTTGPANDVRRRPSCPQRLSTVSSRWTRRLRLGGRAMRSARSRTSSTPGLSGGFVRRLRWSLGIAD